MLKVRKNRDPFVSSGMGVMLTYRQVWGSKLLVFTGKSVQPTAVGEVLVWTGYRG